MSIVKVDFYCSPNNGRFSKQWVQYNSNVKIYISSHKEFCPTLGYEILNFIIIISLVMTCYDFLSSANCPFLSESLL